MGTLNAFNELNIPVNLRKPNPDPKSVFLKLYSFGKKAVGIQKETLPLLSSYVKGRGGGGGGGSVVFTLMRKYIVLNFI